MFGLRDALWLPAELQFWVVFCLLVLKERIFLGLLGIPADADLQKAQDRLAQAKAAGVKLQENPFFWKRAYEHVPSERELNKFYGLLREFWGVERPLVVDPMAGGGSIPFEAMRLGLPVVAGDLNPVAFICLKGTLEYPAKFGKKLLPAVESFCREVHEAAKAELKSFSRSRLARRLCVFVGKDD
jgi:adenine-specific DNA methylase